MAKRTKITRLMILSEKAANALKTLRIKGKVFSGSGEGTKFTALSWVKKQIAEKLGFTTHLGTLNLKITEGTHELEILKEAKAIEILPSEGFRHGKCYKAFIGNLKCAIIIPEVEKYPEDVVEIVSSVSLRRILKLNDGDTIEVRIVL